MARIHHYVPLGAGHVNPTIGIVAELVRRGHDVTCFAPRSFVDRLAATGAATVAVRSTWEGRTLPDGPPQMHGRHLVRAMGLLLEETRAVVGQTVHHDPPDLVLHDGALAVWGRILAHRWGVPSVEILPNLVSNEHWSMQAYARVNPWSPRFLIVMTRIALHLRSEGITDVRGFFEGARAARRLVTIPRAFQYRGDTFTGHRFVGPALGDRALDDGWSPPAPDARVLLVFLGSAYNERPDLYRTIVSTAADRPWHVVLSVGRVEPPLLGPLPPNVEVYPQVPQLSVLAHASAFVTHAGMGGTMEGAAGRVPMVALPQMAEQRANADRIAELGLGRALDPATVTADALWAAVDAVAGDPVVAERLDRMAEEIAAAGGAPAAADEIEAVLP